ncbi:pyrimidodiazepine synthase-like [Chironomus tepperi]|uniref:pyrimidodiazepine synthase-like n=1 Tax=Chironomus tepperi TaxID=113505 RepID=UPI00391F1067
MSNVHLAKGSHQPVFPDDGKLRLYSMRFCPYAQRAHLVLDAKNIPYHVAYINLTEKPEWIEKVSALSKVPALEIPGHGESLIESLIIADYLDEKYPQNPLHSKDPLQKARDRILVERFNSFITPFYRIVFQRNQGGAPGAITELTNALDVYEKELRERKTKFFGGSKPGMLDYMIWPWCERSDSMKFILGDKYELDKVRFSELLKWKDEMQKDKAVKENYISPEDHYKFASLRLAGTPDYDFLAVVPPKKLRLS